MERELKAIAESRSPSIGIPDYAGAAEGTAMKKGRKIIVYIAKSADGYIARLDGDVAWLNRPRPAGNYGMDSFFRSIDTILWGRKTYDFALAMGGIAIYGPKVKHYVFSHHPPTTRPEGVEFCGEHMATFVPRLRALAGKDVWVMGGSGLIASLLDEGEIDEFMIQCHSDLHRRRHPPYPTSPAAGPTCPVVIQTLW